MGHPTDSVRIYGFPKQLPSILSQWLYNSFQQMSVTYSYLHILPQCLVILTELHPGLHKRHLWLAQSCQSAWGNLEWVERHEHV